MTAQLLGAVEAVFASWRGDRAIAYREREGIPHDLDMWGHDVNHDWPWWRKMLPFFIGEKVRW